MQCTCPRFKVLTAAAGGGSATATGHGKLHAVRVRAWQQPMVPACACQQPLAADEWRGGGRGAAWEWRRGLLQQRRRQQHSRISRNTFQHLRRRQRRRRSKVLRGVRPNPDAQQHSRMAHEGSNVPLRLGGGMGWKIDTILCSARVRFKATQLRWC